MLIVTACNQELARKNITKTSQEDEDVHNFALGVSAFLFWALKYETTGLSTAALLAQPSPLRCASLVAVLDAVG